MSRMGKSIEMKSRVVVSWGWEGQGCDWKRTEGDENVPKLIIVIAIQLSILTQNC